ncbi:ESX secretion-associated protein EspG [Nocardia cyriacigeorgica]|uniref:ESX secretion-associated protein EspG n=1 Tax=Nocardia cyriacigeorgica TaxID=135487 RepID=A0A6P1D807_9NOCA|nr:ESX secretion-associated protein EspG [Nocardia cyriacigeorgica]NEW38291.1 ESX secretion-associated protein EspG [Nocardia cyriacigeorgica]NEW44362.1 ESX secretion-associated protein EspG [Nocardia cyriacigeorgica]NEW49234.1 ESX secretion-associated protein EspG [Nocardia cyriacigeorgica]NEW58400.1 ESX secretion-associated protein EspG [Nocardia cyriacigeorgica]
MTVLGAGRGPATLGAVTLSLDEMQFLLELLQIDEVPVVLNAIGRYDNEAAHDAAMAVAAKSLTERELLDGEVVHPELADRLFGLYRPHWVIALRLVVEGQTSRMCLSKGDDLVTVALRGPDSYVIHEADDDLPGPVLSALGPAEGLELTGMNAPTEQLIPIFEDLGDAAAMTARLTKVGNPPRDAQAIASAMVHLESHAEIVGVIYGDGTREMADNHIAVYNTRAGRFLATASMSDDGVKWTSFSGGSNARLRTALLDLINSLPEREDFPGNPALA